VVCWSEICGLGSIEIGSFRSINTLPLDHKSGSPEWLLDLLPDINISPITFAQAFGIGFRTFTMPFGSMLLQDAVDTRKHWYQPRKFLLQPSFLRRGGMNRTLPRIICTDEQSS
jgi:hypothetical protein